MSIQTFKITWVDELDRKIDPSEVVGCIENMMGFDKESHSVKVEEIKDAN